VKSGPKKQQVDSRSIDGIAPLLVGVQTNPERDISLDSLAREWGYSPSHFHRLFTETVGETPRAHVQRVRLERAALRVAVGEEAIIDIALAVGYRNHETFTRAFRRIFGMTPAAYRRAARCAQKARMERTRTFRGDGCTLSETSFLTLKPMTLLAVRRIGPYRDFSNLPPFSAGDSFWPRIVAHAEKRGIAWRRVPIVISYDNPDWTPPHLQHLDACLPVTGDAPEGDKVARIEFAGGLYGAIEHSGPYETIDQAYRGVADGIRRSGRFEFREGPPLQIFRRWTTRGDPTENLTEIYFPVETRNA
jgi:AraC family transcriptional regulator